MNEELALDIAAFASILIKLGHDECVENQKLFVEMCNEAGFRTITGKEFTQMSFRQMFSRLHPRVKRDIKETFKWGDITQNVSLIGRIDEF